MKFNGATFNKAQQDQLKKKVGAELNDVIAKVGDVDSRMLNYTGDWVTGNEYHENDVVTWTDGNLYEVIKAHTSSSTIDPSNSKYYKAMTESKYIGHTIDLNTINGRRELLALCSYAPIGKKITMVRTNVAERKVYSVSRYAGVAASLYCCYQNVGADQPFYLSVITLNQNAVYESQAIFNPTDGTLTINKSTVASYTVNVYIDA